MDVQVDVAEVHGGDLVGRAVAAHIVPPSGETEQAAVPAGRHADPSPSEPGAGEIPPHVADALRPGAAQRTAVLVTSASPRDTQPVDSTVTDSSRSWDRRRAGAPPACARVSPERDRATLRPSTTVSSRSTPTHGLRLMPRPGRSAPRRRTLPRPMTRRRAARPRPRSRARRGAPRRSARRRGPPAPNAARAAHRVGVPPRPGRGTRGPSRRASSTAAGARPSVAGGLGGELRDLHEVKSRRMMSRVCAPSGSDLRSICRNAGGQALRQSQRVGEQVVVVTGASGGIGRAVVRAFAARGARLALLARGDTGLKEALHDVERAGSTSCSASFSPRVGPSRQQGKAGAASSESPPPLPPDAGPLTTTTCLARQV